MLFTQLVKSDPKTKIIDAFPKRTLNATSKRFGLNNLLETTHKQSLTRSRRHSHFLTLASKQQNESNQTTITCKYNRIQLQYDHRNFHRTPNIHEQTWLPSSFEHTTMVTVSNAMKKLKSKSTKKKLQGMIEEAEMERVELKKGYLGGDIRS